MWGYYGSKSKIVKYYPEPLHSKIIEPFAGTAQYALRYWDRDVLLIEKYDVIVNLWKWLQQCSKQDVLDTRQLEYGEKTSDFEWDCVEREHLSGFMIGAAGSMPRKTATKWRTTLRPGYQKRQLDVISGNLEKIRHWDIRLGSYNDIPNQKATWFINPPYIKQGWYYKHGSKDIDYPSLAEWCREREGQCIACEAHGADWLDFKPLVTARGNKQRYKERIYHRPS